ncbi:class II fructose-bisphosphatase [Geopsychrobacter electrodiphilus]|uniref:class II fructose-bisphosphatase n=1 Tax=Geopsychrobacter electrodiphilus TaxID=225196 RepID=UPI000476E9CC
MNRGIALEMARITEAAAVMSGRWVGRGNKLAADAAATTAMRDTLNGMEIDGTVVIGEGEMDEAPMLYIGERLGLGGLKLDIAVDPLEGTTICANGTNGAIATIAMAPPGGFLHAPDMYMDKIITGPAGHGAVDISKSAGENALLLARSKGCDVRDLTIVLLNRPRHKKAIDELRNVGSRIQLIEDGDVAPAVATGIEGSGIDMVLGIGGAPEGVLTAAAVRCFGGFMQGRLVFTSDEEKDRARSMGIDALDQTYSADELAKGEVFFAATGVTNGDLVRGVRYFAGGARTHTVVMRSASRTIRFIETLHYFDYKPGYTAEA